jgi:hypothetical protein
MKSTNTTWSADMVRSGNTFELLIADEGSGRTIIRVPVDPGDISSGTEPIKEAFRSFGAPDELRTDRGTVFARPVFGDLLRSFGVSHTFVGGRTMAERRAKS